MVHIFGFARGKIKNLVDWGSFALNLNHKTEKPNHDCTIQVNYKDVRVFSFEFEKKNEKQFLIDISPFNHGNGLMKNRLKFFVDSLRSQFGLKFDGGGLGKRKTKVPDQRNHITVLMLGYKDGGKKMIKYYVVVESQRKYTDEFIGSLENKQYQTQLPNNPSWRGKLIVKELRLFDITTFFTCSGKLFEDIKPFYAVTDFMNSWVKGLYLFGIGLIGLKKPPVSNLKSTKQKFSFDRNDVGVVVLGMKDDVKLQDPDNPNIIAEMV